MPVDVQRAQVASQHLYHPEQIFVPRRFIRGATTSLAQVLIHYFAITTSITTTTTSFPCLASKTSAILISSFKGRT